MTGKKLSHYQIITELGRGGMGVVYSANDTKLDRTVAIKVLPTAALASEDDRARFYREAKAAAALNHPNIAQVYQIDEAVPEGAAADELRPFIAMEFIDGDTLEDRIKKGPLKLEEAVRIATQVASALKAAHATDIVHRDIKSANIMLTAEGEAKVLDFGLAQTNASTKLTRMGSTLGTVAYMSPEQARGEEVDGRSDLYSLGTVFYEMIAGQSPFGGDYEQAVVYSILNTDADPLTAVRTGVPMELERIVIKALEKDPEYRYQTASDLMSDLKSVGRVLGNTMTSGAGQMSKIAAHSQVGAISQTGLDSQIAVARQSVNKTPMSVTVWRSVSGILAVLLIVLLWAFWNQTEPSGNTALFASLELPAGVTLEPGKSAPLEFARSPVAISPDGKLVAIIGSYRETTSLYVRRLDQAEFDRFAGTEGAYGVEFSPDGSNIAFFANNRLHVVSASGGSPREIAAVSLPYGIVWFDETRILTANNEGLNLEIFNVVTGSNSVIIPTLDGTPVTDYVSPRIRLEDEEVLLTGPLRSPETFILDVDAGSVRRIDDRNTERIFSTQDYLVFAEGSGLSITRSSEIANIHSGPAATITSQLYTRYIPYFDADEFGHVIFVEGPSGYDREFVWLTDDGGTESLGLGVETFGTFKLSPDGQSLAAVVFGVSGSELWVFDLQRGSRTNISAPGDPGLPTWSPDGSQLYFALRTLDEPNVVMVADVGSSAPARVVHPNLVTPDWVSPDGIFLGALYLDDKVEKAGYFDLNEQEAKAFPYHFPVPISRISHSGSHLAFTTNKTGDYEVFVQPFPPDGREWKVTTDGGEEPVWGANDEFIYFRNGDNLYRVDVSLGEDQPTFGLAVDTLFTEPFENPGGYSFDVSPADGRVLLLRTPVPFPEVTSIKLLLNAPALIDDK